MCHSRDPLSELTAETFHEAGSVLADTRFGREFVSPGEVHRAVLSSLIIVIKRQAETASGINYSTALINGSKICELRLGMTATWKRGLTDTRSLVEDNNMDFNVPKVEEYVEIISYLKSLSSPAEKCLERAQSMTWEITSGLLFSAVRSARVRRKRARH
jgi:hypothetical protein